jgi:hypothetical protein
MFHPEATSIAHFRGFELKAFRQTRCNLVERTLQTPVVVFAPFLGRVGVFLPRGAWAVEEALLDAAWHAQGEPHVRMTTPDEVLLFGEIISIQHLPFAGYDDLWLEADGKTLMVAHRRAIDVDRFQSKLHSFQRAYLLERANVLLEKFLPRLKRTPQAVVIHPLRPRILGQCTREGEIRLNLSLLQWPERILEETLAHELVHLEVFNHSPMFWRTLTALLPDWLPRSLVHYL